MRALLLVVLYCGVALAQDPPSDAPKAVVIHKGDASPYDGVFLPTPVALALAHDCTHAQAMQTALEQQLLAPPTWHPGAALLVTGGVFAIGLGFLAGFFIFKK